MVLALQRTLTRSLPVCSLLIWSQTIGLALDECIHAKLYDPLMIFFASAPGVGAGAEATADSGASCGDRLVAILKLTGHTLELYHNCAPAGIAPGVDKGRVSFPKTL